uniref:SOWAHA-C winged helix-turn-helix domain-containing protein n=1 Tax=Periophthalmus magnuspinnatus TaxID=409849 RepID=A0A3B3ZJ33_9GOBI
MTSQCTEQAVREYLKDRGGRVQLMELIDHFLSDCAENEPQEERRETVRSIVDIVGSVKVEDGEKFVCACGRCPQSAAESHKLPVPLSNTVYSTFIPFVSGYNPLFFLLQVRRSLINRGSRLRDSMRSDGDSTSILSSNTDEDCTSVTLDPLEHEWMLCASDGLWESLQPLLAVEPSLVAKKDFVTGFTCLHWAAKQGKDALISHLLTFAKDNGVSVNVNVRSSAGYTPLHLAAMHGHIQVGNGRDQADPEARDYSGRRAIQYLPPPLVAGLHEEGVVTSPGTESDSENTNSGTTWGRWRFPRVLQGNLNPLRLLSPTAEAAEDGTGKSKGGIQRKSSLSRLNARLHRGRHRAQIIHSASFRDSGDVVKGEDLPKSPLRTRPLSNLFG